MKWIADQTPILQLGTDFYDPVQSAPFPKQILRYSNPQLPVPTPADNFAQFQPLTDNLPSPLALRYHGHQFQHYNPDLGDGRGFLFAQLKVAGQWYDLGTKGSGRTPYSRDGDGRLTLKGAVREALATEMLESLGVKTSKTLCFFETGEELVRYDEPSPTRAAVLTRFSLGHIRIGTFQRLATLGQTENIKKLTSYCQFFYYGKAEDENTPGDFLKNVVESSAKLAAQVMMAGFVHGVLNTDNINISGELFDYGPYRFLPEYDPEFTAAYFDQQGLYCFGRQPSSFFWALHQLAGSLKTAYPELKAEDILNLYSDSFNLHIQACFFKRLNLKLPELKKSGELLASFFDMMQKNKLPFEQTFFDFHSKRILQSAKKDFYVKLSPAALEKLSEAEVDREELAAHAYFQQEAPVTLLIDEIENIWKPIAEKDDWSLFQNKLTAIRGFRGLY